MDEYCQILGYPSIRREFCFTWLPMIRPIVLRRPPQSNYPPDAVPDPDHGPGLGPRHEKGGISRLPPPRLAPELQRLPPILHNSYQNSTSSCSKGPRGLSVLMQLTSIFTRTSISPGLWLRQWESRYAIRAGRNLPDKEFRYLRHVVTHLILWLGARADEEGQVISA
jgi:hypothetical protein